MTRTSQRTTERRKSAVSLAQHDILGGKATLHRVAVSGDIWQFRCWIASEKMYVRKTLATSDLATAITRGEELYLRLYSDLAAGRRLFGLTLAELIDDYLNWRSNDVAAGTITRGRLLTLTSQLKHVRDWKGGGTKLSELDRNALWDYAQHRKMTHATADATIKNEQSTLNHMIAYAYREGYAHFGSFSFPPVRSRDVSRRDTFTLDEYDDLVRFLRTYVSDDVDAHTRYQRLMIRDCVLIASNTMLRVGELWQLRWSDILGYETHTDDGGNEIVLVTLNVRAETSKTRTSRRVTTRGGYYFQRLRQRSAHTRATDYVFHGETGSDTLTKRLLYGSWAELMNGIGLAYKARNLTWYSLRHFGITCRLRAGASIFDIAKIVGNSSTDIERHYGHFDQDMSRAAALRNFVISSDGIDEK